MIDLGVHPGFESSEPTGINSVGQVSGFSSRNTEPSRRAFFYDTPHCHLIDIGARYRSKPHRQRRPSTTRPWSWAPSCALTAGYEPFCFIRACFRDLGGDDRLNHHALAVNKGGKYVGFESVPALSTEDAVSYTNGQAVPFPFFGTAYVNKAIGISDSGEVAGRLGASGGPIQGMKFFPNLDHWYQIRQPPRIRSFPTSTVSCSLGRSMPMVT